LLHNRDYYVTMEMQYNLLLDNRNCYITMELPSRPNISQYHKSVKLSARSYKEKEASG
jgi:hypothetical protein